MMVKLLGFWALFSVVLLGWDILLGPLFGLFLNDFFHLYLIASIALFSFALAVLFYEKEN